MRNTKIIYWITTVLTSIAMLSGAYCYVADPGIIASFRHLGFPDYFRVELAIAKALGGVALLIPFPNPRVKEFIYAGYGIALVSAIIAHTSVADPVTVIMQAAFFLAVLVVSWIFFVRVQRNQQSKLIV